LGRQNPKTGRRGDGTRSFGHGRDKPGAAGYAIGVVFALFIVAGLFFALRSGEESSGGAHIATASGSSNQLTPDDREGTSYTPGEAGDGGDLAALAKAAGCVVREGLPEEGRGHIGPDDPTPDYRTVPPTSGDHISPPLQQADGAWTDLADPVNVVHSLEHGRIAIQYDPDLPEAAQLELKGLYDSVYSASLLFPNPDMPYAAAATAWRNLIGCPDWQGQKTLDAIFAFGQAHWGDAPEDVSLFPALPGPTFADPS